MRQVQPVAFFELVEYHARLYVFFSTLSFLTPFADISFLTPFADIKDGCVLDCWLMLSGGKLTMIKGLHGLKKTFDENHLPPPEYIYTDLYVRQICRSSFFLWGCSRQLCS